MKQSKYASKMRSCNSREYGFLSFQSLVNHIERKEFISSVYKSPQPFPKCQMGIIDLSRRNHLQIIPAPRPRGSIASLDKMHQVREESVDVKPVELHSSSQHAATT